VSVETVDEALKAMRYPNVRSVQIIFNMLRLKPADRFFEAAKAAGIGVIARVPLASGLLTGKIRRDTPFHPDDHRHFNRNGESFDRGETFSGVPLNAGLAAVHELSLLPTPVETLTQFALRWILMWDAVTCAIPGARGPSQARENSAAADLPPLSPQAMAAVQRIYDEHVRSLVHHHW
jgi:aryl-alcohol dehydrogenase-like predicted oxidoreductase